jgi:hypothetical protein
MLSLRIGLGVVWLLNLLYVVLPANAFFPTFADTADSFGSTSLGGPGLASFVAGHPGIFSALVAGLTGYLAVAFLLGVSLRAACFIGFGFNLVLLATQFTTLTTIPGGTDVGPQPLYLIAYVALFVSNGGSLWSTDKWIELRLSGRRHRGVYDPGAPAGAPPTVNDATGASP